MLSHHPSRALSRSLKRRERAATPAQPHLHPHLRPRACQTCIAKHVRVRGTRCCTALSRTARVPGYAAFVIRGISGCFGLFDVRGSFFGRKDRSTRRSSRRRAKRGPAHAPPGDAGERCFARRSYSHSRWRWSRRLMPRHCRGASLTMPPPAWQTRRRRSVATGATSASACCTAQGRSRR